MKSLIFTTDIAIIRNCNADAVLAVYPFTPQQVIMDAIISASSIPVVCGVGGGVTDGIRSVMLAKDAEAQVGEILTEVCDLARIYKLSPEQILTDRIEDVIAAYES